jgi:hypothetical protein
MEVASHGLIALVNIWINLSLKKKEFALGLVANGLA